MNPPKYLLAVFVLSIGLTVTGQGKNLQTPPPSLPPISLLALATRSPLDFYAGEDTLPQQFFASEHPREIPIPSSILEFVAKYPQAESFARNYREFYDRNDPIDITQDLSQDGIPLFIQWDPRWGYQTYGTSYFGINGCGPTCISMVSCGLTHNPAWNPYAVGQWSMEHGYYVSGVGTSWALMTDTSAFGLKSYAISLQEETIREELKAGHPVILSVAPGDFTYSGHFLLIEGANSNGTVRINDPNSTYNSAIPWDLSRILSQAVGAWTFSLL